MEVRNSAAVKQNGKQGAKYRFVYEQHTKRLNKEKNSSFIEIEIFVVIFGHRCMISEKHAVFSANIL